MGRWVMRLRRVESRFGELGKCWICSTPLEEPQRASAAEGR
jgi:hypothetical protein